MSDSEKINQVRKVLSSVINNTKNMGGCVKSEKAAIKNLLQTLLGRKPSQEEINLAQMV